MTSLTHTRGIIASAFAVLCFLTACKPDDNGVEPGKGVFYGDVVLFDEYGDSTSDRSGATITATSSAGDVRTATTNAAGGWRIEGIPTEVYELKISHQDFDTNWTYVTHVLRNITHGGAGAQFVGRFSISKVAAMDLVRLIEVKKFWKYDSTWHAPFGLRIDSNQQIHVVMESRLSGTYPHVQYKVVFAATADAACGNHLTMGNSAISRQGNIVTFDITQSQGELQRYVNSTADGRTFYMQIRRDYNSFHPFTSIRTNPCLESQVVPIAWP